MLIERVPAHEPEVAKIGPGMLILAAIGCFALGFAALMLTPGFWPRYVQVATAGTPEPLHFVEAGIRPPSSHVSIAAPGVLTEIKPGLFPLELQRIGAYGTLAGLAECKAAMRAGITFEKVGPAQMAALFGTRGKPLSTSEIDAGCRKLTE